MRINRGAIKSNAKIIMRDSRPSVYLVALVLMIAVWALNFLMLRLSVWWEIYGRMIYGSGIEELMKLLDSLTAQNGGVYYGGLWGGLLIAAINIMDYMLNAGYTIYALNLTRSRPASYGNLLDGFGIFLRLIGLAVIQTIFMFLWSLLFYIPGIIAAYRYRMAIYLLIEHPELSIMDCISGSKRIMKGRKAELFVLDLSFIGWRILEVIPFVSLYVYPYTSLTYANYYIDAAGSRSGSDREQFPPWEYK